MVARKRNKPQSLSAGRPKLLGIVSQASQTSRKTRQTIRRHHQLSKAHAQALSTQDLEEVKRLEALIESNGGLKGYQAASITGQSASRGGDSSKVLLQWLSTYGLQKNGQLEALEVGSLSPTNALSTCGFFKVQRIDLHSQHKEILEQDFMKRSLPLTDKERFDLISLSLVLNYVPDASGRGDMLRRLSAFLRPSPSDLPNGSHTNDQQKLWPAVFMVLPAPCLINSRYLDESRFERIMKSLGFALRHHKTTAKLVYSLWQFDPTIVADEDFAKIEVNPGKSRNNFCVILR